MTTALLLLALGGAAFLALLTGGGMAIVGLLRKRRRLRNIGAVLFFSGMVVLVGCFVWGTAKAVRKVSRILSEDSVAAEKYGVKFNPERIKRGIPSIPRTWVPVGSGKYINYEDPNAQILGVTKPHRYKSIVIDIGGNIIEEYDRFYSGNTFPWGPEQDLISEHIAFKYDYSGEKAGNPWRIVASIQPDLSREIKLGEADQILKSWGMSRQDAK